MIGKRQLLAASILLVVPGGFTMLGVWWLATRCWHKYSRPFTTRTWRTHEIGDVKELVLQTYVVCLSCTKRFEYDLKAMKIGKELKDDRDSHSTAGVGTNRLVSPLGKVEGRSPKTDPDVR